MQVLTRYSVIIFGVAILAAMLKFPSGHDDDPPRELEHPLSTGIPVPESTWPPPKITHAAEYIIGSQQRVQPEIFRNSNLKWLPDLAGIVTPVNDNQCCPYGKTSKSHTVHLLEPGHSLYGYSSKDSPLKPEYHGTSTFLPWYESEEWTTSQLCENLHAEPHRDTLFYHSATLDDFDSATRPDNEPFLKTMDIGRRQQINIWSSSGGVTAQTHYDMSYNFFTQICGAKRFRLWPPSSHSLLQLFPALHPNARHSQVVPERMLENREFLDKSYVVDVRAGDTLYIPPFWFHRVEALSSGVSLNLWMPSDAEARFQSLLQTRVPFLTMGEMSKGTRTQVLTATLHRIVSSVLGDGTEESATDFIARILSTRVKVPPSRCNTLYVRSSPDSSGSDDSPCHDTSRYRYYELLEGFTEYISTASSVLLNIEEDIGDILIGDLVETLAYRTLGDASRVGEYISCCFAGG